MISVSRMLCDEIGPGDELRYGISSHGGTVLNQSPIVVWNCTRRCNLRCIHCYASAGTNGSQNEMTTDEGRAFIRQLADFKVPVLLFSGGEPLMRGDFFDLAQFAVSEGIGVVISTNGTLITSEMAAKMRHIGCREVGISLDGVGTANDRFRGCDRAYATALQGIRNCIAQGQRVSLRMTVTQSNLAQIPAIFDLVVEEGVDRLCFYHLAYAGRGNDLRGIDLSHDESRAMVDEICGRTLALYRRGLRKEVLLVANHADGVYLYLKAKAENDRRATTMWELLRINGGNNSGIRIGAVDEMGNVHPDQFWRSMRLGNVSERPFGDIWMDTSNPVMGGLKDRKSLLTGRCSRCQYLDICNGNLRARAEAVFGDIWAEDPSCYLTDEEIGISG